jgi:GGDEF domain-containing protein
MGPEAADEKATRLNQLAIEAGRKIAGRDLVALSVGIAFCPQDSFDVERLLAEADRRMYSMKKVHHSDPAYNHEAKPPARGRGATVN